MRALGITVVPLIKGTFFSSTLPTNLNPTPPPRGIVLGCK